jgi:predicted ATP-dependent protease
VHVPEGAIPKDGPSAGITLAVAMLSAVRGVASASGFAMTGEITLTGRLLPIGGVKEKVLAAHRYKMTRVLLPRQNEKDLEDIPDEVREALSFVFADSVMDALAILFPQADRADGTAAVDGTVPETRPAEGDGDAAMPAEPVMPADRAPIEPVVQVEPVQDVPPAN